MERSDGVVLDMAFGTWAEAEAWIGRDLPPVVGADRVEPSVIRRRMEALEWSCPLHEGEGPAVEAPLSMLLTLALPPYWAPGDPPAKINDPAKLPPMPMLSIPAPGTQITATDCTIEAGEPIRMGDRLIATSRLVSLTRKRLRIGDGAFMTQETTYATEDGRHVGRSLVTIFRFTPEVDDAN
jgi:hypothetical protein